ncbi:MAG: hypothetical protein K2Z81_10765, partial [Cyanobacteria bacterium]|nr:hypothetical protein [Cyanobacteriota bacterium]
MFGLKLSKKGLILIAITVVCQLSILALLGSSTEKLQTAIHSQLISIKLMARASSLSDSSFDLSAAVTGYSLLPNALFKKRLDVTARTLKRLWLDIDRLAKSGNEP